MRTEEELRAALLALEREAPAAARVLPKTIIRNDNGILPRVIRHRRLAGRTAALGTAAVIGAGVAVVVTLLPGGVAGSHPQARALPSHQALRAKLLDALSAAASEIVYDHTTVTASDITHPYATPDPFLPGLATGTASESWYYPWRANAGQQVRGRLLTLNPDGTPAQDTGVSYPEPTEVQETAAAEFTDVDYAHHTWSEQRTSGWIADSIAGSPLSIWELIHNVPWSVVGRTELDGQPAIKLKLEGSGQPSYLWVNAQTYRPLRETYTFGGDGMLGVGANGSWHSLNFGQASIVTDYQYLAPTTANLAKLTVPIPSGFRQTAQR
jgi:hypothetical protein